jgi:hypothetical protein
MLLGPKAEALSVVLAAILDGIGERDFQKTLHCGRNPIDSQKITFGELRAQGVSGVLIYCADYRCSHSVAMDAGAWPDDLRLSDIEGRFVCQKCGKRGADVRPDFPSSKMGA